MSTRLQRLFKAQSIAFIGGNAAEEAVRQCRLMDCRAQLWPVHPTRTQMAGLPCYASLASLPQAPDVAFVAVNAQQTLATVQELARLGTGVAVCYASGFAEVGPHGLALQDQLLAAAGAMPVIGPNCYGLLDYIQGLALWPDQHGGQRLPGPSRSGCEPGARGVAIITQSGNVGLNLSMQRRALPIAYLITLGNMAAVGFADLIAVLLQEGRVSAIGLHIEGLEDMAGFAAACMHAAACGVPIVALKTGLSAKGAALALSHTSSLAGSRAAWQALLQRYGVAQVHSPSELLETLKLLHTCGPLSGTRFSSASCSGGEASLMADLAERYALSTPDLPPETATALHRVLGDKVQLDNPLDYHTYIWGDLAAQTACFAALLENRSAYDASILVLDFPRADRCTDEAWHITMQAFTAAVQQRKRTGRECCILLSSMAESLPEAYAQMLLASGIAPMMGMHECLQAIAHAAWIGQRQAQLRQRAPAPLVLTAAGEPRSPAQDRPAYVWDEAASKAVLHAAGMTVPSSAVAQGAELLALNPAQLQDWLAQRQLPYPLVVKALGSHLAHKTELAAVALHLQSAAAVWQAVQRMQRHAPRVLIEAMVQNAVCELLLGITRDAQCGLLLTLGAGGVWVELWQDRVTLLLPCTAQDIEQALAQLRIAKLLQGYRGSAKADIPALAASIARFADGVCAQANTLLECEINPLMVLPQGHAIASAVAVDALLRRTIPQETRHD